MLQIRFLVSFLILFFTSLFLHSQSQHLNWPLGNGVSVNFVTGSPVVSTNCSIDTFYPTAAISDENGNLLLYSNGKKIWNRNHEVMKNGEGLLSNSYTSQGVVIIPQPGSSNIFYVITTDSDGNYDVDYSALSGLDYSVVDLNLDSGLGAVVAGKKNINLLPRSSEKLTYIKDLNGNWIFATHFEDKFYFFKIDQNGLNPTPKVIKTGINIPPVYGHYSTGAGTMKFSHDGKKLAISHTHTKGEDPENNANRHGLVRLFDFDINNISLSNERLVLDRGYPMGMEFSPNNEFLYVSTITPYGAGGAIYQYEVNRQDIADTEVQVFFSTMTHGIMQLGPDGKIYKSPGEYNYNQYIAVINHPNLKGLSCDYDHQGLELPHYYKSHWGLPQGYDSASRFNILAEHFCEGETVKFSLSDSLEVNSVKWDFDDIASANNNTSEVLSPKHQFSSIGTFEVTALITDHNGAEVQLTRNIVISETPIKMQLEDLYACEETAGSGYSVFDLASVKNAVLEKQPETTVSFFHQSGEQISEELLGNVRNKNINEEKITVRIASKENNSCFVEVSFSLKVQKKPEPIILNDIYACEGATEGTGQFDFSGIIRDIKGDDDKFSADFFDKQGARIQVPANEFFTNTVLWQQKVIARRTNKKSQCYTEMVFRLKVRKKPEAYEPAILVACDENNDGIVEDFDISNIEEKVIGEQSGVLVSYFDENHKLIEDFSTPYKNSIPFEENITIRVTDTLTNCFSETVLTLKTSSKPPINQPTDLYACDLGKGYGSFDLATQQDVILGNQPGLKVHFYNAEGEISERSYQNKTPYLETIMVIVEDEKNRSCFAETQFDLIVNPLPSINIKESYFLCNLEPFLDIEIPTGFSSYQWEFEDGSIISQNHNAELIKEGTYTLEVTREANGILCSSSRTFRLVRSVLPKIESINSTDWSSNNFIEIIASGEGDFEYSIDGINFQDDNVFNNLSGGVYVAQVRDKNGCGVDKKEVVLVDYPKLFTPNNDGYNDLWQIQGLRTFSKSQILIYNRYGQLLKELISGSAGWDGTYQGRPMPADDYWFTVNLSDGRNFKGHFSLLRGK